MSRQRVRSQLIASVVWLLLLAAGAYITCPIVGPIAASIEPNPLWSVAATGNAAAPFQVGLKVDSWLIWCLAPIAVVWLLGWVFARQPLRRAA